MTPGCRRIPQLPESRRKEFLRDRRWIPGQRLLGRGIIEVPRNDMNVEVRHDIPEQQIVHMTGLEHAFDGPSDILNVRPVIGELVRRKIGEGRDMAAPKHHCHMALSYGVPFEKSLADPAAMEGPAGQIGTKGTSDTTLARFPILRPGSFHVIAPTLFEACSICPTLPLTCGTRESRYHRARKARASEAKRP